MEDSIVNDIQTQRQNRSRHMLAYSYEKMKYANEQEDKRLRRRVKQIAKDHSDRLQTLHKNKCHVVAELRAHRVREVRNEVRKTLREEHEIDRKNRAAQKQLQNKTARRKSDVKGFSKINVEVSDLPEPRAPRRARFLSNAVELKESDQRAVELSLARPNTPARPQFVVLYYPTLDDSNPRRNRLKPLTNNPSLRVVDPVRGTVSIDKVPKRSLPSYVDGLLKLQDEHFDQFTDGSMALEMRRFKQIQRERLPPLAGHLPVRMRHSADFDAKQHLKEIRESLLVSESEEAASALKQTRALGVLDPKKARHYIPKSKLGDEASKEQIERENRDLNKLKKASQAETYRRTLSRVDTFLGTPTTGKQLVHQENLTREEFLMLKTLTVMDPRFGSGRREAEGAVSPVRRAKTVTGAG